MNLSAKHFSLQVARLNEANNFFRDYWSMNTERAILANKVSGILVKPNAETTIFLSEEKLIGQTNNVVSITNDCLQEYCKFKAKGVSFNKAPVYLNEELCAEFSDSFENVYTLLEPRNYSDY